MARRNKAGWLALFALACTLAGSMLLPGCARQSFDYPRDTAAHSPANETHSPAPTPQRDESPADTGGIEQANPSEAGSTGLLVVATTADYPPFEFRLDGELVGFDIELITYIGRRTGREVQLQDMDFDDALSAVAEGRADIAVAAIQPTEERAKDMDFSREYFVPGRQCVVIRAENAEVITSEHALDGAAVACMNGDVAMALLAKNIPGAQIIRTEDEQSAMDMLLAGEVDAAAVSWIIGQTISMHNDQLHMTDIDLGDTRTEGICVAVRKDDEALLQAVNDAIDDAIHLELIDRWMQTAIEQAAGQ